MAWPKLNQWLAQLRDVGKVLRSNLPIIYKSNWLLPRIQTKNPRIPKQSRAGKPLPLTSSKCPPNANEPANSKGNISDIQLGDPTIPSIKTNQTSPPQNGFISRALYYRRFYIRR